MTPDDFLRAWNQLGPDEQRVVLRVASYEAEIPFVRADEVVGLWYHPSARGKWQLLVTAAAERLVMGRSQYGELDLATDTRNFEEEAFLEEVDRRIYEACGDLQKGKRK